MSEPQPELPTGVLLNRIIVESFLDDDGDAALSVRYTSDIQISHALGMLEYAKLQLIRAYERGDED